MAKFKRQKFPPAQAGTVIRKHGESKLFAGPTSFNQTGGFAGNGFKAEDRGASK